MKIDPKIAELQASIDQSKVARAKLLSAAERLRMGADLHDMGMRWMISVIRATNPTFDDSQIDDEVERRKRIKRHIDESGLFQPHDEITRVD
jgi:signal transduction histidine kinase